MGKKIKLKELARDRDQLLWQARNAFESGEHWWPNERQYSNLIIREQNTRRSVITDPWMEVIAEELKSYYAKNGMQYGEFVASYKMLAWVGVPVEKQSPHMGKRLSTIMTALGFERKQRGYGTGYVLKKDVDIGDERLSEMSREAPTEVPGDAFPERHEQELSEGDSVPPSLGGDVQGTEPEWYSETVQPTDRE